MTTRIQPWTEPELMDREAVFEAMVEKALNKTMRALASEVREGILTAAATLPVDPTTTGAYATAEGAVMASWTAQVQKTLYPFLTSTFIDSASRVVDGVQAASGIVVDQLTGTYADEVLQYAYNRMVGIGEALWLNIRDQLVEGYNAGEDIAQIAERLTQVAGLSTPRALTVARTEIISAANNGSYLQMLDAGFEESVTKVWLATEDARTRESHRHADNQGVELTGEFNVDIYTSGIKTGTEPMEFPGDPTATPGNIINCRCSLAFDFEDEAEEVLVAAKAFTEKDHPRDGDGKFKKKGSADKYIKVPDKKNPPKATAPDAEKVAWIATHKWENMADGQKAVLIKSITPDTWSKLSPELKDKIKDAPNQTSHPEGKHALQKAVDSKSDVFDAPEEADDDADTDAAPAGGGSRPLGGVDTKTGKPLVAGKPVKLRVQLLYNTTFEDGAIMAVHKGSGERIVWNEKTKKIERQKLSAGGKYETTEALSRGAAYAAWKDEDGWTIPDTSDAAAPTPSPTAATPSTPAVGKPVKLKVQLIYQTPFDDGDIVAVNPTTGETIHWDAKKKRMVVTSELGTTDYTRGALYKEFKDEDGWHLPLDKKGAPIVPAPVPAKKAVPPAKSAQPKAAAPASTGDKYDKPVLQKVSWNGKSKEVTSKVKYTHASIVATPKTPSGVIWGWHKSEENAQKPALTGMQTKNGYKPIGTVPVVVEDVSAAPAVPVAKKAFVPVTALGGENNDKLKDALTDSDVLDGTVLFEQTAMGQHTLIKKSDDGIASVIVNGSDPQKVYAEHASDTATWIKAIGDAKKNATEQDAAATQVSTYEASDDSNAIYQLWDNGLPGEIWSNGPFSVALAKNGNLLFLDSTPGGGVGIVKSADVNSENIDKALEAVMAGKSWTVNDAIPVVDPDEINAPGGSDGVSAGQDPSLLQFGDGEVDDFKDTLQESDTFVGDTIFENDAVKLFKENSSGDLGVILKSNGKTATIDWDVVDSDHLHDTLELMQEAPPAVLDAPTKGEFPDFMVDIIKNQADASSVPALETIFDDGQVEIIKGGNGNIGVMQKGGGGLIGLGPDDITKEGLEQAYKDAMTGKVAGPKAAPTSATAVSKDKAATLKDWAKQSDIADGDELHNGLDFKIYKAAPGTIAIYKKGSGDLPDVAGGAKILFNDEITADGIENALKELGAGGSVPAPSPVITNATANLTVTGKTMTSSAPKQKPIKLSASVLTGKTSQGYTDGQVIAEHPGAGERLVWNGKTKKYDVQVQTGPDTWATAYSYNKSAALANLKNDTGWVTPSVSSANNAGPTPGQAPVPSIAGSPIQPQNLAPKTSQSIKPKSLFGPAPKFTVSELQTQADQNNTSLTTAQQNDIFNKFKSKAGTGTVYLSSSEKELFESLLETYTAYNDANPGSKVSFLQILRVVDEVSTKNGNHAVNGHLYEKKITAWLGTPTGTSAAKNIATQLELAANSDKKTLAFNSTLAKFQETSSNRAKGSASYKKTASIALKNQAGIKAHTPGQQYPQVMSVAEGIDLAKEMQAKYGFIPPDSKKAMQEYTGSSYVPMNDYMRSFGKSSTSQAKRAELAESGMHPVTRAITVHRNVSTVFDTSWTPSIDQLKDFVGVTFREDAFASTSIAGHAFNGMKYRFIIEIPEGTPLQWVQTFSQVKSEDEFLLASGLHYEILSVHGPNELSGPFASTSNKTAVIKMRVVPPPADAKAQLGVN